jgi:hypothetical protein
VFGFSFSSSAALHLGELDSFFMLLSVQLALGFAAMVSYLDLLLKLISSRWLSYVCVGGVPFVCLVQVQHLVPYADTSVPLFKSESIFHVPKKTKN